MNEAKRNEWNLLKYLSTASPTDLDLERTGTAIRGVGFDADVFLGMAARHGLVPLVADLLGLGGFGKELPTKTFQHFEQALIVNRLRTENSLQESRRVANALEEAEVRFAFTKGLVCQQTLYDGRGTRPFSDMDVMIAPGSAEALTEVVRSLGYTNDEQYDSASGTWTPLRREDRIVYRMYPDHLPHFYRVNPGSLPGSFCVDVAFSLTWHRSSWQVPIDEALASLRRVECGRAGEIPTLDAGHDFLFHVLHLFREAWIMRDGAMKEVRLGQFADVWKGWHRMNPSEQRSVAEIVKRNRIEPPVAWICHHTDALFESSLAKELGLESYRKPEWLASAKGTSSFLSWHGDMDRRLLESKLQFQPLARVPFAEG